MGSLALSVALCTYNGAAFLTEQLESLAAQTRQPDELIVCDDASTDRTVELLEAFLAEAPFSVRIYRNDLNLGYAQNFEKAMTLCRGELIALCDQDDVWTPQKLARLEAALVEQPLAGVVSSDAAVVDAGLQPTGVRLMESIGLNARERTAIRLGQAHRVLINRNFVMGAATLLRADSRDDILPIPPGWPHDWWVGLTVSLRHQVLFIDEPLLLYRQHGANVIGIPERWGVGDLLRQAGHARSAQFVQQARQWEAALERIGRVSAEGPISLSVQDVAGLQARVRHLRARAGLSPRRLARLPVVARELANLGYHRHSAGLASAVKDMYAPLRG